MRQNSGKSFPLQCRTSLEEEPNKYEERVGCGKSKSHASGKGLPAWQYMYTLAFSPPGGIRANGVSEAEEESSIEITDNGIETRISTFALHIQLPADAAIVVPRRPSSLVKNCVNSPWMPEGGAGPGAQKSRNPVQKTMHLE